jgi:hypothetical protein
MAFKKAVRENIYAKICLIAPSGGGKSYSALRLATGISKAMAKDIGQECRLATVDSESRRILYYAKEFDFDNDELDDTTPEGYIKKMEEAINAGYKIIVLDGISPEWKKCLEIHSRIPGNSYTAWDKVTPRHDAFMDYILKCPAHIIATIRGKDKYVLEEVNGKKVPRKVNVGYVGREDTEYQFTLSFNIDKDTHVADLLKDNTHIFESENRILTEKDGEAIYEWANSGDIDKKKKELEEDKEIVEARIEQNKDKVAKQVVEEQEAERKKQLNRASKSKSPESKSDINKIIKEIDTVAKAMYKEHSKEVKDAIGKYHKTAKGNPSANYLSIKDIKVAKSVLNELKNIK